MTKIGDTSDSVVTAPPRKRTEDVLPPDFRVLKELGRGANNRALLVLWEGEERVLRAPRRGGDTQVYGNCKWEYIHTAHASRIGAAPALHAAWYARHAEGEWPSGLYMVMEYFDLDLDKFFCRSRASAEHCSAVRDGILSVLSVLAEENMLLYDLKASNVVLRLDGKGGARVRMIDFGRDFCEWKSPAASEEVDARTPTLDMIDKLVAARLPTSDPNAAMPLKKHLLFSLMLVLLSATTNQHIHEDRRRLKMGEEDRRAANLLTESCAEHFAGMQGKHRSVLRSLLRSDEIRSVLRHYHGRRYAGTSRTLEFAIGKKQ